MTRSKAPRFPALDITRCFALLCVMTYHAVAFVEFYNNSILSIRMYLLVLIYFVAVLGVPLFLILSGYLMGSKRPEKKYYSKISYTLVVYVICSCLSYAYRWYFQSDHAVAGNLGDLLSTILDYTAAPHAWYIAMYIGLFMLIPYLNILYDALGTKQKKQGLLLSLFFVISLPELTNILTVVDGNWMGFQLNATSHQMILPAYWEATYPILYYYLGRYLREYPLFRSSRTRFLAAVAVSLCIGGGNLLLCHGTSIVVGSWDSNGSPLNLVHAVMIFNFLSHLELPRMGPRGAAFWSLLSRLTLGAYLLSWIFENYFYTKLWQYQPNGYLRMAYLPVTIPLVYVCSMALSGCVELVIVLFRKILFRKQA